MTSILAVTAAIWLAAQRPGEPDLVDLARANGGTIEIIEDSCFGPTELPDVLRAAPFLFEGIVVSATTRLTADRSRIYTEYVFEVRRALHEPGAVSQTGEPMPRPPYVSWRSSAQPVRRTPLYAQLRGWGGHLTVDGLDLRMSANDLPTFAPGQHLVLFALYNAAFQDWQLYPTGTFEVRDGRVVSLSKDFKPGDFASVDELAAALPHAVQAAAAATPASRIR